VDRVCQQRPWKFVCALVFFHSLGSPCARIGRWSKARETLTTVMSSMPNAVQAVVAAVMAVGRKTSQNVTISDRNGGPRCTRGSRPCRRTEQRFKLHSVGVVSQYNGARVYAASSQNPIHCSGLSPLLSPVCAVQREMIEDDGAQCRPLAAHMIMVRYATSRLRSPAACIASHRDASPYGRGARQIDELQQ